MEGVTNVRKWGRITFGFHVTMLQKQETVNELNNARETYNAVLEPVKALPGLDSEEEAEEAEN